jgi:hypothetical protein
MDRASGSVSDTRRGLHHRLKGFERRHLLGGDLLLEADRLGLHQLAFLAVSRLQRGHVGSMLASTCSIRFFSLPLVKFLSQAFTALNLLPSIAATVWLNGSSRRHRSMNLRQVARIAGPLSFLKSAMVLKSGASRPVSHISSTLRWASRSSRRLDAIWLM